MGEAVRIHHGQTLIAEATISPTSPAQEIPGAQVVLDQLAECGTCDQVRAQLQPWDRAADVVTIVLPPGTPWHNVEATLQAAAPGARPDRAPGANPPSASQATPTGDGRQ